MKSKDDVKFRKGELVSLLPYKKDPWRMENFVDGWRSMTSQELADWDEYNRQNPQTDDGEPRIRPRMTIDHLPEGRLVVIVKARCRANIDWYTISHLSQVVDTTNGNTYYIRRRSLKKLVNDESATGQ